MRGIATSLCLKPGPFIFIEHRKVRKPLNVVRIILQNHTSGEPVFQFFDQTGLEFILQHRHTSARKKIKKRYIPSIIRDVFFAGFLNGAELVFIEILLLLERS